MNSQETNKNYPSRWLAGILIAFLASGVGATAWIKIFTPFINKLTSAEVINNSHEGLTKLAWEEFEKKNYSKAIENAKKCIEIFKIPADNKQKKLEEEKISLPPLETTLSQEEITKIHELGYLNDVASSFFIIGESYKNMKRIEDAKNAYEEVRKYTYARAWNPEGKFFWSQSIAAKERLVELGVNIK